MTVTVRPMLASDWATVQNIYRAGIATGNATFEEAPPSWDAFDAARLQDHRHVAVDEDGDVVVGWVAVSPVSARAVYRGVVEHSIYIAAEARGRGAGHALLEALIASCEAAGIWTIQSGVFPENAASRALHAAHGFRELGVRERIGYMSYGPWVGRWRDNVIIERRSRRTGA